MNFYFVITDKMLEKHGMNDMVYIFKHDSIWLYGSAFDTAGDALNAIKKHGIKDEKYGICRCVVDQTLLGNLARGALSGGELGIEECKLPVDEITWIG